MKEKIDNNLILVKCDGKDHYFTSWNKAGVAFGFCGNSSMAYYCAKGRPFKLKNGKTVEVFLVDGSDVPYKMINNKVK